MVESIDLSKIKDFCKENDKTLPNYFIPYVKLGGLSGIHCRDITYELATNRNMSVEQHNHSVQAAFF